MSLYSRIRSGNKDLRVQMSEQQAKLSVVEQHSARNGLTANNYGSQYSGRGLGVQTVYSTREPDSLPRGVSTTQQGKRRGPLLAVLQGKRHCQGGEPQEVRDSIVEKQTQGASLYSRLVQSRSLTEAVSAKPCRVEEPREITGRNVEPMKQGSSLYSSIVQSRSLAEAGAARTSFKLEKVPRTYHQSKQTRVKAERCEVFTDSDLSSGLDEAQDQELDELLEDCAPDGTIKQDKSHWKSWCAGCAAAGISPWRIKPITWATK